MNSFLCFVLLLILICVRKSIAVNSCFYCESLMHGGCVDPFDKINGTPVDCRKFLDAPAPPKVTARMFHPRKPFEKVFEPTRWKRSAELGFRCAKTQVEYSNSSVETIRMCVPVNSYQPACPHLRQNIGNGFLMMSCHECNDDNCNGSQQIGIGVFVSSLSFLIHKLVN